MVVSSDLAGIIDNYQMIILYNLLLLCYLNESKVISVYAKKFVQRIDNKIRGILVLF
jgi:hypothetical protein